MIKNHARSAPCANAIETQTLNIPPVSETGSIASDMISRGMRPFSLKPFHKTPTKKDSFKNSISDVALINAEFLTGQNIGLACGHKNGNGLAVIDYDVAVKGEPMDLATMDANAAMFQLATEVMGKEAAIAFWNACGWVSTPSGGWQQYFKTNPGIELKCATKIIVGEDGSSVDARGHGGYVVAPGSSTCEIWDGEGELRRLKQAAGTYQTKDPAGLPNISSFSIIPDELVEKINALKTEKRAPTSRTVTAESEQLLAGVPIPEHAKTISDGALNNGLGFSRFPRDPKDAAHIKEVLLNSIQSNPSRYEDYNGWLHGIALPLAGAVATGELSEEEGKAIFDAANEAAPGSKNNNEYQWNANLSNARDRVSGGNHVV